MAGAQFAGEVGFRSTGPVLVHFHGTPSGREADIGSSAPYSGRYRALVHSDMASLYGLSLNQYVRIYKTNAAGLPDPTLPWRMVQIAGWHDGLVSAWGSMAPHHVLRLGPEGRRRLHGSTTPSDFNGKFETATLSTYPSPLWGSRDETESVLVGDDMRFNLVLPPMALASLGVNVGARVRVWRDGNNNGKIDDAGTSCDTLDTPPCFAVYTVAMAFESETNGEQPARMGRDGRDRLGVDTDASIIVDRTLPGTSVASVRSRVDTAPLSLTAELVDDIDADRHLALPSPLREALGLDIDADVKVTNDANANGVADVGEPFLIYKAVADYDLPLDEPKYNRVRMAAVARDRIGVDADDAVIVSRANLQYAHQPFLVLTTQPNAAHPENGGMEWIWGGYDDPSASSTPTSGSPSATKQEAAFQHWSLVSNANEQAHVTLNKVLVKETKSNEHIALPQAMANALQVIPGQQVRVWLRLPTLLNVDAEIADLHCDANLATVLPYKVMTVAAIYEAPLQVGSTEFNGVLLGDGAITSIRMHLSKYGGSAVDSTYHNLPVVVDRTVIYNEANSSTLAGLKDKAEENGQLFEHLRPLAAGHEPKLLVMAPHGGNIETKTNDQAEYVYNDLVNQYNGVSLWAYHAYWGGVVDNGDPEEPLHGDTWRSSHITAADLDRTQEQCLRGSPSADSYACKLQGKPWHASFPGLAKINHLIYKHALAFHGFASNPPQLGEAETTWCGADDPDLTPKVCIFIGGMATEVERRCFLKQVQKKLDVVLGGPGVNNWSIEMGPSGPLEVALTHVVLKNGKTGEVRIRLATKDDTLSGTDFDNVVNRLSYSPPRVESIWCGTSWCLGIHFQRWGGVQYEQSKSARELYWQEIAIGTVDAFKKVEADDLDSCGL